MSLRHGNMLNDIAVRTSFQNGEVINRMDASCTMRILCRFRMKIFAGTPHSTHRDARTNFYSSVFEDQAAELGKIAIIAPTRGHNRIDMNKQCPVYLRTVYKRICVYLSPILKNDRFSLTFWALNNTFSSYTGICPSTLLYEMFPVITESTVRKVMIKEAETKRGFVQIVSQVMVRRKSKEAQKQHNTTSKTKIQVVRTLEPGYSRIACRERNGGKQRV